MELKKIGELFLAKESAEAAVESLMVAKANDDEEVAEMFRKIALDYYLPAHRELVKDGAIIEEEEVKARIKEVRKILDRTFEQGELYLDKRSSTGREDVNLWVEFLDGRRTMVDKFQELIGENLYRYTEGE